MLDMRLAMAVSGPSLRLLPHAPVQVALGVQPRDAVPLGAATRRQLRVVGRDVAPAVVGEGRELAVVLQLVLQLRELCHDPLALAELGLIRRGVRRAVHVVDGLGEDDGPSRARRRVRKRRRVAGAVLRCACQPKMHVTGELGRLLAVNVSSSILVCVESRNNPRGTHRHTAGWWGRWMQYGFRGLR
jgi:hypothetical protein